MNMLMYSMFPLILAIMFFYKNIFISMEMPLMFNSTFFIPLSILMDWVSLMFMSTVMMISSMIILFSIYYIPMKEHKQFILMLMMFILSMVILIMSDNIIFILLGWDGLGLSSYILVIYYQNFSSAASGSITLLSNRAGDIMILLSISILLMNSNWNFNMNQEFPMISMIFMMTAAMSKSAQYPFSAWLPAAMAAPTPISALVHSSTLVTAGVFLLIRIMNNMHPISMFILMLMSSATALFSSMAANWEQDMKKIIALSTLSQIAMMMFSISMKSSLLAFFHLIIHAMFKSTMFLCAGIMIHNSSFQDMRMMGMNTFNSSTTHSIIGLTSMALMGIPFMSGFFSKDSIIEFLINMNINSILTIMMLMSIGMTASYTIRMSIMSNMNLLKSKSNYNLHFNKFANVPIILMAPMSIILGALMMWSINPQQMFILSIQMKMYLLLIMMSGMLIGKSLSFKKNYFNKMGKSAISLWFIHFMTSSFMLMSPFMNYLYNNDKMWQEIYGPKGMFMLTKMSTKLTESINLMLLFSLMMIMIIPMIM